MNENDQLIQRFGKNPGDSETIIQRRPPLPRRTEMLR